LSAAGLVLAAGSSRRMGRPKQLLPLDGRPLLERVVAAANASSLDEVVVVLGGSADEIKAGVRLGRARVVYNSDHIEGLSSSIRAGLASLDDGVDRAVVILGDQPAVTAELLNDLLELQASSGLPSAALRFGDLLHPPVVLDRSLFGDLASLEGDVGCRAVIRGQPELVASLSAEIDANHPIDIDTPADYERLLAESAENSTMSSATDPRVDAYIDALPEWQQAICRVVRRLVRAADDEVSETIKRTRQPYFVLQGNICALLATKDHVNVFLYDGGIVPDPEGIITGGHDNKTGRTVAVYEGETLNERALTAMFKQIIANNRAGGWRKLKRA
jgi:CTP:molybdopterin cytidylyltransferase MocA